MTLVIKEVAPPTKNKGGKQGSIYLTKEIQETAAKLKAGTNEAFFVGTLEGKTVDKMLLNTSFYLNKWGKTQEPAMSFTVRKSTVEGEDGVYVWRKA